MVSITFWGPKLSAALIFSLPRPGISTCMSRGIETRSELFRSGFTWTIIIVSDRAGPTSCAVPKASSWRSFLTKARVSEPMMRKLAALAGAFDSFSPGTRSMLAILASTLRFTTTIPATVTASAVTSAIR